MFDGVNPEVRLRKFLAHRQAQMHVCTMYAHRECVVYHFVYHTSTHINPTRLIENTD